MTYLYSHLLLTIVNNTNNIIVLNSFSSHAPRVRHVSLSTFLHAPPSALLRSLRRRSGHVRAARDKQHTSITYPGCSSTSLPAALPSICRDSANTPPEMSHNKSQATTVKNRARLMQLLQEPCNKHCADCKTSRNPRWASWNLGMFICIRCSGIHRSLGTHISRVKSVDLDSWTDEQTESMCSWGNKRANAYWESKLKPRSQNEVEMGGYIPLDGKVESFVRTKYVLGKWKDDGPREASRYQNVKAGSVTTSSASTTASNTATQQSSTDSDPLSSLLDIGSSRATTSVGQSPSSSSLPDRPTSVNRSRTNPTLSLLEQHSGPSPSESVHLQQQQQQQQRINGRPDLKKSILSLYSSPSPSASNVSLGGGYSNNISNINRTNSNTGSSVNSTFSNINTPSASSNIWGSTSNTAAATPSTQNKNIVGEDPFRNVWN